MSLEMGIESSVLLYVLWTYFVASNFRSEINSDLLLYFLLCIIPGPEWNHVQPNKPLLGLTNLSVPCYSKTLTLRVWELKTTLHDNPISTITSHKGHAKWKPLSLMPSYMRIVLRTTLEESSMDFLPLDMATPPAAIIVSHLIHFPNWKIAGLWLKQP